MKTLSEESMVSIECGGIEALASAECLACGGAILGCALGVALVWKFGLVAVIGAILGFGEEGVLAAVTAAGLVGEGLSQCGTCWDMLTKE